MVKVMPGFLVEYALSLPPLVLQFHFNPNTISRTRSVTVNTGNSLAARGGYDFAAPSETARASQGVTVQAESFSIKILLDATDRMDKGDPIASTLGVQPEIDTLRTMIEPKSQLPSGLQVLSSLGGGGERAFARHESASVLLFIWGLQILPVFMTNLQVNMQEFLPHLAPYRAEATVTLQIIESNNPFYQVETLRQTVGAALNTASTVANALGGLF